jgi:hypothetical protein
MKHALQRTLGALAVLAALAGTALAEPAKVVVELFTSQGCSSCPPADAFLAELAKRDDVIALSFHVDYWNYLGWKDPFSTAESTQRQRDYRAGLGLRYVYTPQMVIDGAAQAVGSGRAEVLGGIEKMRGRDRVAVSAARGEAGELAVTVGEGADGAGADIWLAAYDRRHSTEIRRGENSGVTLINAHVVRSLRRIGRWSGRKDVLRVTLTEAEFKGRDGCAVIVQKPGGGPILGATAIRMTPKGF